MRPHAAHRLERIGPRAPRTGWPAVPRVRACDPSRKVYPGDRLKFFLKTA
jgi:hypothetical protein